MARRPAKGLLAVLLGADAVPFKEPLPCDEHEHELHERVGWKDFPGRMTHLGDKIMGETAKRYHLTDTRNHAFEDTTSEKEDYRT